MMDLSKELADTCNCSLDCPAVTAFFCPFTDAFEVYPCLTGAVSKDMWDEVKEKRSEFYDEAVDTIKKEE